MLICDRCKGGKKLEDIDYNGYPNGKFYDCPKCQGTGKIPEEYIDPTKVKLTDLVRDNKKVRFAYFRDKEFWYRHENGLMFPIALSEVDNPASRVTLNAEDKAIYFMRWIKKYIESCKADMPKEADECRNSWMENSIWFATISSPTAS